MANFGLICPPGTSHVTGLASAGRELQQRGHRVAIFNILDVESTARGAGMHFVPLGAQKHPLGSFQKFSERLTELKGLAALRYGLEIAGAEIEMLLDEAPPALRAAGITALLVDQGQPAGSTLAELLGIPFITICNAPPANSDPRVPPTVTGWSYGEHWAAQARNRAAYFVFDRMLSPLKRKINRFRKAKNLKPLRSLEESFSPFGIIAQQTSDFDFPRQSLPPHFHYIGLFKRTTSESVPFPFERLNGKPLIYASFGTVLTARPEVFRALAQAAQDLDAQLAISLGGRAAPSDYPDLPGDPIVVRYAPQTAVLQRSALTFCHAGNNTVLESLASGVPVLALPMFSDQPGVAARLVRSGAGQSIRLKDLNRSSLAAVCERLLRDTRYRQNAERIARSIHQAGGEARAAQLIEACLAHP